ncbi:tripartite tricarboxylate transporter substrate binding protein [Variovorax sp. Sphag1AA]|uniref:Bug family tripartite tricarboxylate transporter substrate binding protein n=1 Tax=Variovorax sp. Sphag1AA TaxID=2587027 RepID=UPI00161F2A85|nr:tripartite tricarboxylate transporter substrate binding protein [Variovorax sp. Sphag1AA]MBB3182161.1 tripartite-type tricarboxylate transporter receptor subunit TctC [Variovorax sp. Sphag1AA]
MRPSFAQKLLCAISLTTAALGVCAQGFPSRPITIIAPFAAGGSADGIARIVARELQQTLGQSVVVDNRPGAGGATGLIVVANTKPDGYTIGMGAAGAIVIGPHLPDAPPLNPEKQLQPLAKLADIPLVLVSGANSGYGNLQALLNAAKTTEVPVGNAGQYTAHHLSAELLASTTKTKLPAIPYRGSAPAVTDVIGGQVPLAMVDLTSVAGQLKAGTVRALGVTSAKRSKLAPEIPSISEAVPGYAAPGWLGMFAPKGVPADVSDKLAKSIQTVLEKPEVQAQILNLAAEPAYLGPKPFTAFIDAESRRWATVIAGLPKQPQK